MVRNAARLRRCGNSVEAPTLGGLADHASVTANASPQTSQSAVSRCATNETPATVAASGDSKKARSRRTTGFVANVTIVIEPVGHHGRFRACVDGRVIVASTRQPFLDAARVLIGEGHDRRTILEMRRAGADQVSLHGPL